MTSGAFRYIAVCSLNSGLAGLGVLVLPFTIGSLESDSHLSPDMLGLVAFMELAGAAITTILASACLKKSNLPMLCAFGAVLLAAGNIGSAFVLEQIAALLALRLVAGIGAGFMAAGMMALTARLPAPEHMYSYLAVAPCVAALLTYAVSPSLIAHSGNAASLFAFQGALAALCAVVMGVNARQLVRYVASQHETGNGGPATGLTIDTTAAVLATGNIGVAAVTLSILSYFFLGFGDSATWTFANSIGAQAGLSNDDMSTALIITAVAACFAPILAARIGLRYGAVLPIAAGHAVMIVTSAALVMVHDATLVTIVLVSRVFAGVFLGPLYSGLLARIDPVGRVVTTAYGFNGIAYGVGPLVAGQAVAMMNGSYMASAVVGIAASIICMAFTLMLILRHDRAKTGEPSVNIHPMAPV